MTDLTPEKPKRKVLSLKLEPPEAAFAPRFVENSQSHYLVWNHDGGEPKRLYKPDERERAIGHAKALASQTGSTFHVFRTYRCFKPEAE